VVVALGTPPALARGRTPVVTDDTSVTGVSNRSRNLRRSWRRGIPVAITPEVMVAQEVSVRGLANDKTEGMKYAERHADHRSGMTDSALAKAKVL